MKNIKGEYILYSENNAIPYNNWYRDRIKCIEGFTQEQLNERRNYEILKYSDNSTKLTKSQRFSQINKRIRNLPRTCNTINKDLLNVPLTGYYTRRQYSFGGSRADKYFDSIIPNFDIPFKIIKSISININTNNINDSFNVNELSAINDSNTDYSSMYSDWLTGGSCNIYGRYYTTANNDIISNLDNIIYDISSGLSNHLNVQVLTEDGTNKSLKGYIGVYSNKVYFISNDSNQISTSSRSDNDKINNNTKVNIKLVC